MAAAGAREPRDLRGGQTQGTMPQGAKADAVSHWSWATVSLPWGEEGTEPGCCGARTLPPLGQTERRRLYPSEAAASQPPACEITGPQDLLPWGQPPPAAPTHPGTRLSWESSREPAPCWGAAASPNPPLTPNVAREVQELSGDHTGGAKPLDLQTSLPLRPPTVGHHPKSPPNSRRTRLWWQQPRGRCGDSGAVPYAGTKPESSRGPVPSPRPGEARCRREPGQGSRWAPERCLRARTAGRGDSEARREIQTHSRPPQPSDRFPGSFRFV